MLSFGIRVIGFLGLGRVLRCYVVHLGKILKMKLRKKTDDLKVAHVACWEGVTMSNDFELRRSRLVY